MSDYTGPYGLADGVAKGHRDAPINHVTPLNINTLAYKTVEQRTLDTLERIERLLLTLVDHFMAQEAYTGEDVSDVMTSITPTETPFSKAIKPKKGKK